MSSITRRLTQLAVYWKRKEGEVSDETGQVRFEDPIEVPCRWFDQTQTILDTKGNQVISRAWAMVDRDLTALGVLWLPPGEDGSKGLPPDGSALAQVTDAADPFGNDGAFEIRSVKKIKRRRGDYYREVLM